MFKRKPTRSAFLTILVFFGLLKIANGQTALPDTKLQSLTDREIEEMLKEVSNWGRWGKDDELGTLNFITAAKRMEANRLVREGQVVSMAHDLIKEPFDSSDPFEHKIFTNSINDEVGGAGDFYGIKYHGFAHTHIDALNHISWKGKIYNGFSAADVASGKGKNSIRTLRNGIVTRAVLMDMPALFGVQYLKGNQAIYPAHLELWEKQSGVRVGKGDAILINTGRWTRREKEGPWEIMQNSAGLHASCLKWLHEREVALVGSDLALDVMPSGTKKYVLPVHLGVMVQMGSCILDCLDFRAVAQECRKRKQWEFQLLVAPLRVEGGTGSPVNPLAVF